MKNHYSFCASSEIDSIAMLLHGWGASGDNLISLGKEMSEFLPRTLFIAPNAPYNCWQFDGYEWFSIADRSDQVMFNGVNNASIFVNKLIDENLKKFSLMDDRLIIAGFSQGGMLAIHTALCRPKKCAGVISYSGAVIAPDLLRPTIKSKPKICLVHGKDDQIVPFSNFVSASEFLKSQSIEIKAHQVDRLGHSIDYNGIKWGAEFIKSQLLV